MSKKAKVSRLTVEAQAKRVKNTDWKEASKKRTANTDYEAISKKTKGIPKSTESVAKRVSNTDYTKISESNKGKLRNKETKQKMSDNHSRKKAIIQYDKQGNKIAEYESIAEACRKNNLNPGDIYKVAVGKGKTGGGYVWKYKTDISPVLITTHKNSKSVIQYTKDGQFIKEWNGATEAGKFLNIKGGDITNTCKQRQKTAGGFIWEYKK